MPRLVALAVAQTALLVLGCAFIGTYARSALTPWNREVLLSDQSAVALGLGAFIGIMGGVCVFLSSRPFVAYARTTPLVARLLYGGLTEEIIVRWGLLSAVLWGITHTVGPSAVSPAGVAFGSIVLTNAAFAAGHLPVLRAEVRAGAWVIVALIFVVSLPWGWLALTFGLGSAMAAHVSFHAGVEFLARVTRRGSQVDLADHRK